MRHRRRKPLIRAAALSVVALTGACAHNDVLVFGTSTTIGLNVETASTNGAAPSIVVGYEREEAVWMPLVLNRNVSELDLCVANAQTQCVPGPVPLNEAMYRSRIITGTGQDRVEQIDTYSVFASLGARFNGKASGKDGVEAGGGLAQFFATGNAAVNISANEALVTALKFESPAGANAQALAVGHAAALTAEQQAAVRTVQTTHADNIAKVQACAATSAVSWTALVNSTSSFRNNRYLLGGADTATGEIPAAQIASRLGADLDAARELAEQADKLCPATP